MDQSLIMHYVSEYGRGLTSICLKLCRNRADAEDLYQETWYKVCRYYHKYDRKKPFEPWLYSVCVNTYKSFYKKKMKGVSTRDFLSTEEKDEAIENISDDREKENDQLLAVKEAVDALEDKYRSMIILYYFKEFTVEELASILKIPAGTVKSRLYKARALVRRRLEADEEQSI